jgi:endonuclease-3
MPPRLPPPSPKPDPALKRRARRIFEKLAKAYPDAHCELDYQTPFQLLCATILSAQCTDKSVNRATPALFAAFPDAAALAKAKPAQVEKPIKTLGLYHNKARFLIGMAQALMAEHGGEVPKTREALVALPGVGRKTANVVLSNAFGLPGLAVDTHVLRVGQRLGLFQSQDPVKVEQLLGVLMPPESWGQVSHWLIWHGRRICVARKPACPACVLQKDCPSRGLGS